MSRAPNTERELAEKLADSILKAAGSGFQHYTPHSKERIIEAAIAVLSESSTPSPNGEAAAGDEDLAKRIVDAFYSHSIKSPHTISETVRRMIAGALHSARRESVAIGIKAAIKDTQKTKANDVDMSANGWSKDRTKGYDDACGDVLGNLAELDPDTILATLPIADTTATPRALPSYTRMTDDGDPLNLKQAIALHEASAAQEDQGAVLNEVKKWQNPSYVRLHAGEMGGAEMRSVQAVLSAIVRACETQSPQDTDGRGG
jgi:ubiquitin